MSVVRGWCPSAHRPMMSGDGMLVRVRPRFAAISAEGLRGLARLSRSFGNGYIDLTSRGNLQLRGVLPERHDALLAELIGAGLVDPDPLRERLVTVTPFWRAGDASEELARIAEMALGGLPDMPGKVSVLVDAGAVRHLSGVSGDFRLERSVGGLILRADGAEAGWPVTVDRAAEALGEMVSWALANGLQQAGRMRRVLSRVALPKAWCSAAPVAAAPMPGIGLSVGHVAIAFGRLSDDDLEKIGEISDCSGVRLTPFKSLWFPAADHGTQTDISVRGADISEGLTDISVAVTDISDARLRIDVCPGAPACGQGKADTRSLAVRLAEAMNNGRSAAPLPIDAGGGAPLAGVAKQGGSRLADAKRVGGDASYRATKPGGDALAGVERQEPGQCFDAARAGRVHISGCAKGCARQGAAEITLVAQGAPLGEQSGVLSGQNTAQTRKRGTFSDQGGLPVGESDPSLEQRVACAGQSDLPVGEGGAAIGQSDLRMKESGVSAGQSGAAKGQRSLTAEESGAHVGLSSLPVGESSAAKGQSDLPIEGAGPHLGQSGPPTVEQRSPLRLSGRFDLVENGTAKDTPLRRGLTEDEVLALWT